MLKSRLFCVVFIAALFAVFTSPTFGQSEFNACKSQKLKAASKLCKSYLGIAIKEISLKYTKEKSDAAKEMATDKFAISCLKAEAKASKKGEICSEIPDVTIENIIKIAVEDMNNQISSGLDLEDKDTGKLCQALLKAAQKRCDSLFKIEIKNSKKPDSEKLSAAKSKADGKFSATWTKALSKAESSGVVLDFLPSMSEIEKKIDELVRRVLNADKYNVVVFDNPESDIDVLILGESGNNVAIFSEKVGDEVIIENIVLQLADGTEGVIQMGSNGLPALFEIEGYQITYTNYTSSTMDVTVISPDGSEISYPNIFIGNLLQEHASGVLPKNNNIATRQEYLPSAKTSDPCNNIDDEGIYDLTEGIDKVWLGVELACCFLPEVTVTKVMCASGILRSLKSIAFEIASKIGAPDYVIEYLKTLDSVHTCGSISNPTAILNCGLGMLNAIAPKSYECGEGDCECWEAPSAVVKPPIKSCLVKGVDDCTVTFDASGSKSYADPPDLWYTWYVNGDKIRDRVNGYSVFEYSFDKGGIYDVWVVVFDSSDQHGVSNPPERIEVIGADFEVELAKRQEPWDFILNARENYPHPNTQQETTYLWEITDEEGNRDVDEGGDYIMQSVDGPGDYQVKLTVSHICSDCGDRLFWADSVQMVTVESCEYEYYDSGVVMSKRCFDDLGRFISYQWQEQKEDQSQEHYYWRVTYPSPRYKRVETSRFHIQPDGFYTVRDEGWIDWYSWIDGVRYQKMTWEASSTSDSDGHVSQIWTYLYDMETECLAKKRLGLNSYGETGCKQMRCELNDDGCSMTCGTLREVRPCPFTIERAFDIQIVPVEEW